jgi:hypothetical protein
VLIPYYAPHSGSLQEEIEKSTQEFSEFLNKIPTKNSTIIIGANINASTGTRSTDLSHKHNNGDSEKDKVNDHQTDTILNLPGPHGNPHRNKNGEMILNPMREHNP